MYFFFQNTFKVLYSQYSFRPVSVKINVYKVIKVPRYAHRPILFIHAIEWKSCKHYFNIFRSASFSNVVLFANLWWIHRNHMNGTLRYETFRVCFVTLSRYICYPLKTWMADLYTYSIYIFFSTIRKQIDLSVQSHLMWINAFSIRRAQTFVCIFLHRN